MNDQPMIYSALVAAMQSINAVGKNQINEQQHWKFRGIDDVYNALQPALIAAGICVATNVIEEQHELTAKNANRCILKVEYKLFAADGSNIIVTTYGQAVDYGDKSYSKAMSMAYKYMAFQTFVIPTEEMRADDPDRYVPDEKFSAAASHTEETIVKPTETALKSVTQASVNKSASIRETAETAAQTQTQAGKAKMRNAMIAKAAKAAGTDLNGIMANWKQLQKAGTIPSKTSSAMTDEEFATSLAAVAESFAHA